MMFLLELELAPAGRTCWLETQTEGKSKKC